MKAVLILFTMILATPAQGGRINVLGDLSKASIRNIDEWVQTYKSRYPLGDQLNKHFLARFKAPFRLPQGDYKVLMKQSVDDFILGRYYDDAIREPNRQWRRVYDDHGDFYGRPAKVEYEYQMDKFFDTHGIDPVNQDYYRIHDGSFEYLASAPFEALPPTQQKYLKAKGQFIFSKLIAWSKRGDLIGPEQFEELMQGLAYLGRFVDDGLEATLYPKVMAEASAVPIRFERNLDEVTAAVDYFRNMIAASADLGRTLDQLREIDFIVSRAKAGDLALSSAESDKVLKAVQDVYEHVAHPGRHLGR